MSQGHFVRVLNNKDVLALAFGAMIGWGWVVLAGNWVQTAGAGGAMLAFAIGGVAVIRSAICGPWPAGMSTSPGCWSGSPVLR